jgi:hypothetical protein
MTPRTSIVAMFVFAAPFSFCFVRWVLEGMPHP